MRVVLLFLALSACKNSSPQITAPAAAPAPAPPPVNETAIAEANLALDDLKHDLKAAQSALDDHKATGYLCDRLAVSIKALNGQKDAALQQLISDARTFCGLRAPLMQVDYRLKQNPPDCASIREHLRRISSEYRRDAQVVELMRRQRAMCAGRGGGGGHHGHDDDDDHDDDDE